MTGKASAPMVAAGIGALEEALCPVVEIPPSEGVPAIRLEAPAAREIGPVARRFRASVDAFSARQAAYAKLKRPTKAQQKDFAENTAGMFADAVVEASVGALVACVRDPADPLARLSVAAAWRLQAAQDTLPTEQAAWRSALKLTRLIDLDAYDRAMEEELKAAEAGKRRGSGEAAAPTVDFPPNTS